MSRNHTDNEGSARSTALLIEDADTALARIDEAFSTSTVCSCSHSGTLPSMLVLLASAGWEHRSSHPR
jgi:hypothetical protein